MQIVDRWREEENSAQAESENINERLLRGETVIYTCRTYDPGYHPPLSKWVAANELEEALSMLPTGSGEGEGETCHYCKKPITGMSSIPSEYPVPLFHADGSGRLRWHHNLCVLKRLGEVKDQPGMPTLPST